MHIHINRNTLAADYTTDLSNKSYIYASKFPISMKGADLISESQVKNCKKKKKKMEPGAKKVERFDILEHIKQEYCL